MPIAMPIQYVTPVGTLRYTGGDSFQQRTPMVVVNDSRDKHAARPDHRTKRRDRVHHSRHNMFCPHAHAIRQYPRCCCQRRFFTSEKLVVRDCRDGKFAPHRTASNSRAVRVELSHAITVACSYQGSHSVLHPLLH